MGRRLAIFGVVLVIGGCAGSADDPGAVVEDELFIKNLPGPSCTAEQAAGCQPNL